MRRRFLALSSLTLVSVALLIFGTGFGLAQTSRDVKGARPTPTPLVAGPGRAPPAPESADSLEAPPRPDLIVDRIEVIPSSPRVGEQVTIRVTIKNQGEVDVAGDNNFLSDLWVDPPDPFQPGQTGTYYWGCQATWVPAGGSHVLETKHAFDRSRTFNLYAQVDTQNNVDERRESNNALGPVSVRVRSTIFIPVVYRRG
jgi:hypothetical protein